jgi:hypothetical protein
VCDSAVMSTPDTESKAEQRGHRYAGAIYGTILAMSVVAAGANGHSRDLRLAVAVVATSVVFWLAHVYAEALGRQIAHDRRYRVADRVAIAREEWPMAQASLPFAGCLLLGGFGIVSGYKAEILAMIVGILALGVWGYAAARAERASGVRQVITVLTTASFGVVLFGLKLVVQH